MGRTLLVIYVVLTRLSFPLSLITLGVALRWVAYIGDIVRTQDYYDFAEPVLPSPQVTYTYTYTILTSPTVVTYTDTDTETFSATPFGSSIGALTTYTHTGTYSESYSSGQAYASYYSTRYGTATTFTPPVVTVAKPSCRGGCTIGPTSTSTVTATPTLRGTLFPTPTTRSPADAQRVAEVRQLVAEAKHSATSGLICLSLLILGLLLHVVTVIALAMCAASPEYLLSSKNDDVHPDTPPPQRIAALRWSSALFILFSAWNIACGIAFLVLIAPQKRATELFAVFAAFFGLKGVVDIGATMGLFIITATTLINKRHSTYDSHRVPTMEK